MSFASSYNRGSCHTASARSSLLQRRAPRSRAPSDARSPGTGTCRDTAQIRKRLKLLFQDQIHPLRVERGKAGRVGNKGIVSSAYSSMCRVVCRPLPSFSETSPTARCSSGQSLFKMLDLPTPELPVKAESLPEIAACSSSMPRLSRRWSQSRGSPRARKFQQETRPAPDHSCSRR